MVKIDEQGVNPVSGQTREKSCELKLEVPERPEGMYARLFAAFHDFLISLEVRRDEHDY